MNISSKPLRLFINNYLKSPKNSKPSAYKKLISLYNNEKKSFIQALKNVLYEILNKLPLYKNTQKTLKFIAKSINKILKDEAKNTKKKILYEIFEYIINLCYSEKIKVRIGAVYFLILLKNAQLDVKGKVYKNIISLIKDLKLDKSKLVRYYAVELAEKFNMNKVLLGSLVVDPSEKVRKKCLELISLDCLDDNIILSKLYDCSYEIRLNVLMKLQDLAFKDMSDEIIYRVFNLAAFDCEEKVKLKAREILYGFIDVLGFRYFCEKIRDDNGVVDEVLKLRLLSNEENAMSFHEKLCGKIENSDLVDIYLIRLSSEVIRSINKPLFADLNSLITLGHKHANNEYYTINILKTLKCFDLYHEDIQISVLKFIKNICCNFPITARNNEMSYDPSLNPHEGLEKVYENSMHIIKQTFQINKNEYWKFIKLLIDETIEEYLQKHQKIILNQEKNYEEKGFISQEYREKDENAHQDIEFLQKCEIIYQKLMRSMLIIANGLKYYQSATLDIDFLELLNYLILPSLAYSNNYLRFLGLSSLGYCCLLSFDIAEKYLYIFIEEVKTKSFFQYLGIKYLFDIFCTFSYIKLPELDKAIVLMFEGLSSVNEDLLKICIIGFFKLIINDRIPECYGILLKIIILSSSCLSAELKKIIFYGFKEYVLASEKKARKYIKMVKVFIGMKSEEEKDCLENEGKIKVLGKLFDVVDNTKLEGYNESYHFSLVYYICELFTVYGINRRTVDEVVSYAKWALFTDRQLMSLLMIFKTSKQKTNTIPTAIQKLIKKSIRLDTMPIDNQKEKKRSASVEKYIKRYYNALTNPSSIFCLLSDYYENSTYNSIILPIKRSRFDLN